ncbi:hypothetical protein A2232_01830 [candidate division WOR-1 bacterium RIFOXYA2_FULL_46_56]|nr:MAG: hypothetical protein A2232_01830 [candidate division WOR-1 bacterium RIFOXYA2_FULL_46_56]
MTLIVQLWETNPQLAEIAEQNGADAILVNGLEGADEILGRVSIPVGVNLNPDEKLNKKTVAALSDFDFVNFGLKQVENFKDIKITRLAALGGEFSFDSLMGLDDKVEAIDAAIVPVTDRLKNLEIGDLQNYISVIISSSLPVLIPTDRMIKPSEVSIVWDAGAKGLILTSRVLGETTKSLERNLKEYRIAADDL